MPRLSDELGVKLLVKREDMTGLAMGGNKTRTLDYLLVEAKKNKADAIVTTCGIQSNWSRQTVAAAIKLGMKPSLVLRTAQFKRKPKVLDGNILLDHIMGADIKIVDMGIDEDPEEYLQEEAKRLRKKGFNPVILGPKMSSSPPVAGAYAECVFEMQEQTRNAGINIDAIVVANGSGATHAGLALGAKILGFKTRVIGVNIGAYKTSHIIETILETAAGASKLLGTDIELQASDVDVREGYEGKGYGFTTKSSNNALKMVARKEGLIIDPVYTAKTMAFLIDAAKDGEFKDKTVCFMHTGGIPALFPYRSEFQPKKSI
jgi:D-cysteine desulfhydrase family pyridoxal phosphate-dependent enzyme